MPDLNIDFGTLSLLAQDIATLRGQIDADVKRAMQSTTVPLGGGGSGSSDDFGHHDVGLHVVRFYNKCHNPFADALSRLENLEKVFRNVGHAFAEFDAGVAQKANAGIQSMQYSAWAGAKDAYDKAKARQAAGTWDPKTPLPRDPGPPPSGSLADGTTDTTVTRNGQGQVLTETNTSKLPDGTTYTETTTYSYDGADPEHPDRPTGYTTTITHADGSADTLVWKQNGDGSSVLTNTTKDGTSTTTVTPKPRPEGAPAAQHDGGSTVVTVDPKGFTTTTTVTDNLPGTPDVRVVENEEGTYTYTGNADTGGWTQTEFVPTPIVETMQ